MFVHIHVGVACTYLLVSVPARVKSSHYITLKRELYIHHAVWACDSGDGDTVGGLVGGVWRRRGSPPKGCTKQGATGLLPYMQVKIATKCGESTCALDSEAGGDTIKRMLRSNEDRKVQMLMRP